MGDSHPHPSPSSSTWFNFIATPPPHPHHSFFSSASPSPSFTNHILTIPFTNPNFHFLHRNINSPYNFELPFTSPHPSPSIREPLPFLSLGPIRSTTYNDDSTAVEEEEEEEAEEEEKEDPDSPRTRSIPMDLNLNEKISHKKKNKDKTTSPASKRHHQHPTQGLQEHHEDENDEKDNEEEAGSVTVALHIGLPSHRSAGDVVVASSDHVHPGNHRKDDGVGFGDEYQSGGLLMNRINKG